jgi:hypothetical protein
VETRPVCRRSLLPEDSLGANISMKSFCRLARARRNVPEATILQTGDAAIDASGAVLTVPCGGNP